MLDHCPSGSGGSAALIMAWYHPELYHRVLTFSGAFVNQQWPLSSETPDGAWGFHTKLIPESAPKPIRLWMAVGDRDLHSPNVMRDGMHDWVEANNRMATVLKAKGYHYQYLYCLNAGHGVGNARAQILPHALEWLWKGYIPLPGLLDRVGKRSTRICQPRLDFPETNKTSPVWSQSSAKM